MTLDRPRSNGACARHALLALLLAAGSACQRIYEDDSSDGGGGGSGGGGRTALEVDFALRTDLTLGSGALGDVLHADLDRDGIEDLIEADFGGEAVTFARGQRDGSFTTLERLATAGHAAHLAAADLDGDGTTDVAVASSAWIDGAAQAVQVFLQGPTPFTFAPLPSLALGSEPKDLCAAPLSGRAGDSGPAELFVALRDEQRVLRLALDAGALVAGGALDSTNLGLGSPASVTVIDARGDGWLDLVVGEENPGFDRVLEYPRDGGGFLPAALLLAPLARPGVRAAGDVDGNGFEDLAIAQLGADQAWLLAGDATGLTDAHAIDFGGATSALVFADLDGDGRAEAMATLFEQDALAVRRGLAPFDWAEAEHYDVGPGPRALAALSLPGDAYADLVCANAQDVALLFGLGNGRFRGATGAATGGAPVRVATADLDGDGDADAVALTRHPSALVFLENAGGRLAAVSSFTLASASASPDDGGALALADLDGDGDVDVLVPVPELDELCLFRNEGGPASFLAPAAPDVIAVGPAPTGLALGDLDGDGRIDAVVSSASEKSLRVLFGRDGGTFVARAPQTFEFAPLELVCADFDRDGSADVAASVAGDTMRAVALFGGDGRGGLRLDSIAPLSARAGGLALGDLDEDGRTDLVVGALPTLTSELAVLVNRGALSFDERPLTISPGPGTPLVADADEDGHLDLVVLTSAGELALVRGDGRGGFVDEPRVPGATPCPAGTVAAALADLDGDHLPELLMVTPAAPFVWSAHNLSREAPSR